MNTAARALLAVSAAFFLSSAQAELPDPAGFGRAIELGDIRSARRWLDEGMPPDFEADVTGSGLMIAAGEGNIPLMQLFIERGANINYVSRIGEQAIALAAWKGHQKAVEWLIEQGASLDPPDRTWSALHYAAFAGKPRIVDLLVARGAKIDARAPNLATPLMMAVREGNEGIAKTLVDAGASTTAVSDRGENALAWALRYNRLKMATLVAPPENVAEAVSAPALPAQPAPLPPQASIPAPPEVSELLKKLRQAEAQGKPTDALRRQFMAAVESHRKASAKQTVKAAPSALVISAKRGSSGGSKAGGERAELVAGGATPAAQTLAADAGAIDILRALQEAQAKGQPTEELRRRFRAAVDQMRQSGR
ncbi:ankyrin repeat domain-containing protein [Methyloversatilis universalis]|uniref:ankyrin repeat domain-containing protein n=1 Tax=Methyloversatilis universalis TaxID=378211 RepID=UPI0003674090|nr:ankyrin repeat domain-containing protein [Methyloversatilis universalis]